MEIAEFLIIAVAGASVLYGYISSFNHFLEYIKLVTSKFQGSSYGL